MTPAARRVRRVLSGLIRAKIHDKYAIMAALHQWKTGEVEFGRDMSDCIPVIQEAIQTNEIFVRSLLEGWEKDVKMDARAEFN